MVMACEFFTSGLRATWIAKMSVYFLIILILVCSVAMGTPVRYSNGIHSSHSRTLRNLAHPTVYRCGEGSMGKEMVVNFVNTNYPENDISDSDCEFRLVVTNPDICQIRVDFVDTELLPPTRGECLSQYFIVEGSLWQTGLPPICGINYDQHFYVHLELELAATNATVIDFKVKTVVKGRPYRFGAWITQIDCYSFNVLKAPEGCTQWFLQERGAIKSFNFEGYRYLSNQDYTVCIKPGKGVCGIRYEAHEGEFSLKKTVPPRKDTQLKSGVGSKACGKNYILIHNGRPSFRSVRTSRLLFNRRRPRPTSTQPDRPSKLPEVTTSWDRYCGSHLSTMNDDTQDRPIYARVRSNLISMKVKTSPWQEARLYGEVYNLTAGFRVLFQQLRDCENYFMDVASPMKITSLVQTLQYNQYLSPLLKHPTLTDPLNPLQSISQESMSGSGFNTTYPEATDEDEIWDYLDSESEDIHGDDLYDFWEGKR